MQREDVGLLTDILVMLWIFQSSTQAPILSDDDEDLRKVDNSKFFIWGASEGQLYLQPSSIYIIESKVEVPLVKEYVNKHKPHHKKQF